MIADKRIRELAEDRMKEIGDDLFIVAIKVSSGNKITVEVDRMNGSISIDDCVSISRNIEHNLDRSEEDFELEVSSAGIDQPFRVVEQYKKNIGRDVKVKFNHGKIEGILNSVHPDSIVVTEEKKERVEDKKKKVWVKEEHDIPFDTISETYVKLKFK